MPIRQRQRHAERKRAQRDRDRRAEFRRRYDRDARRDHAEKGGTIVDSLARPMISQTTNQIASEKRIGIRLPNKVISGHRPTTHHEAECELQARRGDGGAVRKRTRFGTLRTSDDRERSIGAASRTPLKRSASGSAISRPPHRDSSCRVGSRPGLLPWRSMLGWMIFDTVPGRGDKSTI